MLQALVAFLLGRTTRYAPVASNSMSAHPVVDNPTSGARGVPDGNDACQSVRRYQDASRDSSTLHSDSPWFPVHAPCNALGCGSHQMHITSPASTYVPSQVNWTPLSPNVALSSRSSSKASPLVPSSRHVISVEALCNFMPPRLSLQSRALTRNCEKVTPPTM